MAAIIEIMGHTVTFDGIHWTSDKPEAARICARRAKDFVAYYFPDPVNSLAEAVAESLNGRVIQLDPEPPNDRPEPDHLCY